MSRKYWNPTVETISKQELHRRQLDDLQEQAIYVYDNSDLWKDKFAAAGLVRDDLADIDSIEAFQETVPILDKQEIRDRMSKADPYGGTLCVDGATPGFRFSTSGTTGRPTFFMFTQDDMERAVENLSRCLWMNEVRDGDGLHLPIYRWHSAGELFNRAGDNVGAPVYPTTYSDTGKDLSRTVEYARMFEPNAVEVTPIKVDTMVSYAEKHFDEPVSEVLPWDVLLASGDVIIEERKQFYREEYGYETYELGGTGEMGYGSECREHDGIHFFGDMYFVETVDPDTGEPTPPGELGELLITSLWQDGTPYLRFKTGDMVTIDRSTCACGRAHPRVTYHGRKSHTVVVEGARIYPASVESVLFREEATFPATDFQLVRHADSEQLHVRTVYDVDAVDSADALSGRLTSTLETELDVPVRVDLLEDSSELTYVQAGQKIIRVVDETDL